MRLEVDVASPAIRDVGVALGRSEIRMAEHLLHRAEVCAALEEVRRERVAQEVGVDPTRLEAGAVGQLAEDEKRPRPRERTSTRVQEQLGPVATIEMRASEGEVASDGLGGRAPEWDEALLASLAEHPDDALLDCDAAFLETGGLGDTQPGSVQELDEGTVA